MAELTWQGKYTPDGQPSNFEDLIALDPIAVS
jgi:hypothetical protein